MNLLKKYKIPKSWNDINLVQFNKIVELEKKVKEMEYLDYIIQFVSILLKITPEEVEENFKPEQLSELAVRLLNITQSKFDDVKEEVIEIDGKYFMFDLNFEKMVFGQFVDLDIFGTDKTNIWDYAQYIAASFIRPVNSYSRLVLKGKKLLGYKLKAKDFLVKKYDSEDVVKNAELFLNKMPVNYVHKTVDFFLSLEIKFKAITRAYSQTTGDGMKKELTPMEDKLIQLKIQTLQKKTKRLLKNLTNAGAGIPA